MRGINLIPARRRLARERGRRVRLWACGLAAYAVLLAGAHIQLGRGGVETRDRDARIARARAETESARQEAERRRSEIAREESALLASGSVAGQPDWSMLFALIARTAGQAIWIESAALKPAGPAQAPTGAASQGSAPPGGGTLVLSLAGLGESHDGVSSFVLGLERAGLFSRVSLLETRRQAHHQSEAVAFRVECLLEAAGVGR